MSRIELRGDSAARLSGAKLAVFWRLILAIAMLSGCAMITKESPNEEKQALAAQQAAMRWELIIKGDAAAAYDKFMSPGSRQVITRGDFAATMKRTEFRSARVEQVDCAGESCRVTVRITYDYQQKKGIEMKGVGLTVVENWIIENGRLWYVWAP